MVALSESRNSPILVPHLIYNNGSVQTLTHHSDCNYYGGNKTRTPAKNVVRPRLPNGRMHNHKYTLWTFMGHRESPTGCKMSSIHMSTHSFQLSGILVICKYDISTDILVLCELSDPGRIRLVSSSISTHSEESRNSCTRAADKHG